MSRRAALAEFAHGLEMVLAGVKHLIDESDEDPNAWVDQVKSPLGRRRHCRLARTGALVGARKVSGQWLVRRRELDRYIERQAEAAGDGDSAEEAEIIAFKAPSGRKAKR